MQTLTQDVRFGLHALARSPLFTIVAATMLALGIGANLAVFAAVKALFLRPLPYPDASRLVFVWGHRDEAATPLLPVSLPVALRIAGHATTFDRVGAWTSLADTRFSLTGVGEAEDVQYAVVSAGLLDLLGARAAAGRTFRAADDRLGAPHVAVISDRLWRRGLGALPSAVGQTLTLDGAPYTVVGVLDPAFRFVDHPRAPDVWLPLGSDPFVDRRFAPAAAMGVVAHLRTGATLERAQEELTAMAIDIGRSFPPLRGWTLVARGFDQQLAGGRRPLLAALTGAAAVVLLLACANLAALLLARATSREREIAVRQALGASRARIVRQLMAESLLLALAGAAAGLVVAEWGADVLAVLAAGESNAFVPWRVTAQDLSIDGWTLCFALGLSTGAALLFGLAPAWHAARASLASSAHDGMRVTVARHHARAVLVAAQVALSLVLLVGAGLLLRSFGRLAEVDAGFTPAGAVAIGLPLPAHPYDRSDRTVALAGRVLAEVGRLPGVRSAGIGTALPLAGTPPSTDCRLEGEPSPEPGHEPRTEYASVSPGWFDAIGVRLVAGRTFRAADDAEAARVAVINEAMARRYYKGRDPIGRRIALSTEALRFPAPDRPPILDFTSAEREIVGIVGDVRQQALDVPAAPAVYVPLSQRSSRSLVLVARGADPEALGRSLQQVLRSVDPDVPAGAVQPLRQLVTGATEESRFRSQLVGAFGALAVLLAAIGIYGLVAYSMAQRVRELAVHVALGATPRDVVRLGTRVGLKPAVVGLCVGLPAAYGAARGLEVLLFDMRPFDPPAFSAAVVVLLVAAFVASWMPARRAARVDPIDALRAE